MHGVIQAKKVSKITRKSIGIILILIIVGAILSIYISDILGCLIDESQIQVFNIATFTSVFIGVIIGAMILRRKWP